jgi:hypothetical protein
MTSLVIDSLKDHFFRLCLHKFASNVIEKCFETGSEEDQNMIINEVFVDSSQDYPPLSLAEFSRTLTFPNSSPTPSPSVINDKHIIYLSQSPVFKLFLFIYFFFFSFFNFFFFSLVYRISMLISFFKDLLSYLQIC